MYVGVIVAVAVGLTVTVGVGDGLTVDVGVAVTVRIVNLALSLPEHDTHPPDGWPATSLTVEQSLVPPS